MFRVSDPFLSLIFSYFLLILFSFQMLKHRAHRVVLVNERHTMTTIITQNDLVQFIAARIDQIRLTIGNDKLEDMEVSIGKKFQEKNSCWLKRKRGMNGVSLRRTIWCRESIRFLETIEFDLETTFGETFEGKKKPNSLAP